ncbi:MAG: hypothetical protein R3A45_04305 [Bdellovibrionota bacterium]
MEAFFASIGIKRLNIFKKNRASFLTWNRKFKKPLSLFACALITLSCVTPSVYAQNPNNEDLKTYSMASVLTFHGTVAMADLYLSLLDSFFTDLSSDQKDAFTNYVSGLRSELLTISMSLLEIEKSYINVPTIRDEPKFWNLFGSNSHNDFPILVKQHVQKKLDTLTKDFSKIIQSSYHSINEEFMVYVPLFSSEAINEMSYSFEDYKNISTQQAIEKRLYRRYHILRNDIKDRELEEVEPSLHFLGEDNTLITPTNLFTLGAKHLVKDMGLDYLEHLRDEFDPHGKTIKKYGGDLDQLTKLQVADIYRRALAEWIYPTPHQDQLERHVVATIQYLRSSDYYEFPTDDETNIPITSLCDECYFNDGVDDHALTITAKRTFKLKKLEDLLEPYSLLPKELEIPKAPYITIPLPQKEPVQPDYVEDIEDEEETNTEEEEPKQQVQNDPSGNKLPYVEVIVMIMMILKLKKDLLQKTGGAIIKEITEEVIEEVPGIIIDEVSKKVLYYLPLIITALGLEHLIETLPEEETETKPIADGDEDDDEDNPKCQCNVMAQNTSFTRCDLNGKVIYLNGNIHMDQQTGMGIDRLLGEFVGRSSDKRLNMRTTQDFIAGKNTPVGTFKQMPNLVKGTNRDSRTLVRLATRGVPRPTMFAVESTPAAAAATYQLFDLRTYKKTEEIYQSRGMTKDQFKDLLLVRYDKIFFHHYRDRFIPRNKILPIESVDLNDLSKEAAKAINPFYKKLAEYVYSDMGMVPEFTRIISALQTTGSQTQTVIETIAQAKKDLRKLMENKPELSNDVEEFLQKNDKFLEIVSLRDIHFAKQLFAQMETTYFQTGLGHVPGVSKHLKAMCRAGL